MVRNQPARQTPTMLSTLRPFLFPTPRFPSLSALSDDLTERANEMLRAALGTNGAMPVTPWVPAMNVVEDKQEYRLTADLPGLSAKDISIEFYEGTLTIRGEKQEEAQEQEETDERRWYLWERQFGSFERSLPFQGVDEKKISAEFKDGVLTVRLPKAAEARAKHRAIPVNEKK